MQALGCTCITISHRPALMAFHDLVLSLDGKGNWSLEERRRAPQPHRALPAPASPGRNLMKFQK